MPRPALTDEQKRAIRKKIRQAAAKLYADSGISNISARSVAEEAGVSVGTLYAYFDNLPDLMQSLWREPARRLVNEMDQMAREVDSPVERLEKLLHAYVDFAVEQSSVFRSAFMYVRPEAVEPPPRAALDSDRFFQLFRTSIEQGQQEGVFRQGETTELAQMVISAIHGSLALPVNFHRLALDTSPKVARHMIDAMLEWLQAS